MIQTRQLRLTMTTAEHHFEPIVINLLDKSSFNYILIPAISLDQSNTDNMTTTAIKM